MNNYGLLHRGVEMGDCLSDFSGSMLLDETIADEIRAKRVHALRRGRIITDRELLEGEDGEVSEGDQAGDDQAAEIENSDGSEIKWTSLPEGLKVLPAPEKLDESLVNKLVFIRWEPPHGWSLGTITHKITSATPRLYKKFNYGIKYIDGSKGPANIPLDNYNHGPNAAYNSWCLLEKDEDV